MRLHITAGLLVAALSVAGPFVEPAFASHEDAMVSVDGVGYTSDSVLPIFNTMGLVVPGDQRTESVWVRNGSTTDAILRLDLLAPISNSAALAENFSLTASPHRGRVSGQVTIKRGIDNGECTVLSDGIKLGAGESVQLDISAAVSPSLTEREGALETVSFGLRAVLRDAQAQGLSSSIGQACTDARVFTSRDKTHEGGLSVTGVFLPQVSVVLLCIVTGLVLCVGASRKRKSSSG
ncbi:hypothetical protein [Lysinibacter sp. HNR]|uniref:hypothetical protein n=1 Tax=Lysinibacter sp. HNR TaxID=3031408 RepID=UPI002435E909|nr:hypothetical protein [Lysinibacter sp. HNR]WGD37850.1 hypothetical protein FrondiHNR_02750 [Lysinibacter sp. HNR]